MACLAPCRHHISVRQSDGLRQRSMHCLLTPAAAVAAFPHRRYFLRDEVTRSSTTSIAPYRRRAAAAALPSFGGLFGQQQQQQQQKQEEEEEGGSAMVQLDADSSGSLDGSGEAPFGALAVLAVGFTAQEFSRLRRLLHEDMGASMVTVIPATAAAMEGTLGAALEQDPALTEFEQVPSAVCFGGTLHGIFLLVFELGTLSPSFVDAHLCLGALPSQPQPSAPPAAIDTPPPCSPAGPAGHAARLLSIGHVRGRGDGDDGGISRSGWVGGS